MSRRDTWDIDAAPLRIQASSNDSRSAFATPCRVAAWVRSAPTAGGVAILDLRRGRWLSLNATGSAVWSALANGQSVAPLADKLSAAAGVDRATVARGINSFMQVLESEALTVTGVGHCPVMPRLEPPVEALEHERVDLRTQDRIVAVLLILIAHALLRLLSLERIASMLANSPCRLRSLVSEAAASRFLRAAAATSRSKLLRSSSFLCLERSLATVLWCRLTGVPAHWCLGASSPPFAAHAWAEFDGLSIAGSRSSQFVPVLRT